MVFSIFECIIYSVYFFYVNWNITDHLQFLNCNGFHIIHRNVFHVTILLLFVNATYFMVDNAKRLTTKQKLLPVRKDIKSRVK